MFKNRSIQVKVVKDSEQSAPSNESTRTRVTPEQISKIVQDHTKQIAIIAGVGVAALKILDTASSIAVITADRKIK